MRLKLEKDQVSILLLLIIGLLLISLQNSQVGMYYDDYGNASLSYGKTIPDVEGTNYSFGQLVEWVSHCYMNWGGRILYAVTFLMPLLKNGIEPFMMAQSFVVIFICMVSYKIICHYTDKKFALPSILLLYMFYGLIGAGTHVHGTYWASASVLYLWPLLPLLLSFYLYMKACRKIRSGQEISYKKLIPSLIPLLFFAACSQEQVGLSVLVYFIFYILFDHLKEWKKYKKLDFTVLIVSLVSYLILFCAPGNFVRLGSNSEFAEMSFFEKISFNMPRILDTFFINDMTVFNLLLLAGMFIMAFYLIKKSKVFGILGISTVIIALLYIGLLLKFIHLPAFVLYCVYFVFLVNLIFLSLCYFHQTKRMEINALVFAGGASVFCLLYSPTILERSYIEYIFFVFILLSILFIDCYERYSFYSLFRMGAVLFFSVLCIKSVLNFRTIYKGYKQNAYALEYNHQILRNYSADEGKAIYLAKLPNYRYRVQMPYDTGFSSMEYWYKEYYNIPHGVSFQWGKLEVGKYLQIAGDFFDDGWFGKEGSLTVDATKIKQIGFVCNIPDYAPITNQLLCTIGEETVTFEVKKGTNEFTLDLSDYSLEDLTIDLRAESTYNPKKIGLSEDARDLSMVLSVYQK